MRYTNPEMEMARPQEARAAIFVDYQNLFVQLKERLGSRERPDEIISDMLDKLRRYLQEELDTQTATISAYADFSEMYGNGQYIQRALYMRGIEPRFVPAALQRNAAEIQLCVDAADLLHTRSDIRTFVIVTGDRPYLPLVQQFKRHGCHTLIATLNPPPSTDHLPYVEDDVFFDALNLVSVETREGIEPVSAARVPGFTRSKERPEPVEYREVTHEGAHRALEIIEEYFGQYEEVYLTPLLRKLSELLDDEEFDPKTLISELEDAGAVWLEKRRGFPYDYTVLLIDGNHPDVLALQEEYQSDDADLPFDDMPMDGLEIEETEDLFFEEEEYADESLASESYSSADDQSIEDYT